MKKWLIGLLLLTSLLLPSLAAAQVAIPPAPTSSIYVQDYAGVLGAEAKNKINEVGARLAAKTKAQVVVVTLKSTEGQAIDELGLAFLRQWGIGDKKLNNGVVLLVAVNDRQSRIEVGYGLEGALPDGKTGRIQDEYMIPYFKNNQYEQGILNGYFAIIGETAKEYNVDIARPEARAHSTAQQTNSTNIPEWLQIAGIALLVLLLVSDWVFFGGFITGMILSILFRRGGGGGFGGGSGGGGYGGGSGGGGGSNRNW